MGLSRAINKLSLISKIELIGIFRQNDFTSLKFMLEWLVSN